MNTSGAYHGYAERSNNKLVSKSIAEKIN